MPSQWVYAVEYKNKDCKIDAIKALNAIAGVSAENDNRTGELSRNVTVTVTGSADPQIPGRILKIFGSVKKKFLVFKVTFKDSTHKKDALRVVNALKGVAKTDFDRADGNTTEYGSNTPLTLKISGNADPEIVRIVLKKYGTVLD